MGKFHAGFEMRGKRPRHYAGLRRICVILLTSFQVSGFVAPVQMLTSPEYQVKAVFLFNFTQFVEWPEDTFARPNSPLVIGVLGEDPFGTYLDETIAGEKIDGHPLTVRRYHNVQQVKNCHILFVNLPKTEQLAQALTELKGQNILTVSDAANFIRQGGIVQFITENKKIRIQINPETARASDLTISSKLLRVAEIVK